MKSQKPIRLEQNNTRRGSKDYQTKNLNSPTKSHEPNVEIKIQTIKTFPSPVIQKKQPNHHQQHQIPNQKHQTQTMEASPGKPKDSKFKPHIDKQRIYSL